MLPFYISKKKKMLPVVFKHLLLSQSLNRTAIDVFDDLLKVVLQIIKRFVVDKVMLQRCIDLFNELRQDNSKSNSLATKQLQQVQGSFRLLSNSSISKGITVLGNIFMTILEVIGCEATRQSMIAKCLQACEIMVCIFVNLKTVTISSIFPTALQWFESFRFGSELNTQCQQICEAIIQFQTDRSIEHIIQMIQTLPAFDVNIKPLCSNLLFHISNIDRTIIFNYYGIIFQIHYTTFIFTISTIYSTLYNYEYYFSETIGVNKFDF
jgi:hypothetical protein